MMFCRILLFAALTRATVTIIDPSVYADIAADDADNELIVEWDYTPTLYQLYDITDPYFYTDTDDTISHDTLQVAENDTSVIVITQYCFWDSCHREHLQSPATPSPTQIVPQSLQSQFLSRT